MPSATNRYYVDVHSNFIVSDKLTSLHFSNNPFAILEFVAQLIVASRCQNLLIITYVVISLICYSL